MGFHLGATWRNLCQGGEWQKDRDVLLPLYCHLPLNISIVRWRTFWVTTFQNTVDRHKVQSDLVRFSEVLKFLNDGKACAETLETKL